MRHDPGREVTIHRDRRAEDPGGRVEVHTPEEMRAVLAAAVARSGHRRRDVSRSWARLSPLLHLLVYTGLRSSELRGLPPDAIDLGARTLRVRQRADEAGRIGPPKSRHAYRTLTLPEPLIPILGDWLGTLQSGTRLVFPARDGDPLTLAYLRSRMWEPVQREAGVPYRNLHAARHFYASRLVAAGATPLELQRALGHHDAASTLRTCGHLFGGEEAERRRAALVEAVVL
jgi:integrase